MAARYWRLNAIDTYGRGVLSLSEIALYAGGVRVDAPGSLTATTPDNGSLTDLQDGSAASVCSWSASKVRSGGFAFKFDLGSAHDVSAVRFGTGGSEAEFVRRFRTESSADGISWTVERDHGDVTFPGANSVTGDVWDRPYPASLNPLDAQSSTSVTPTSFSSTSNTSARGYLRAVAGVPVQFEIGPLSTIWIAVGVALSNANLGSSVGSDSNGWAYDSDSSFGYKRNLTGTSYGSKFNVGDVIGVVVDGDNLVFYKNGVSQGVAFTGMSARTLYPMVGSRNPNSSVPVNMGGAPFQYPVAGAVSWAGPALGVVSRELLMSRAETFNIPSDHQPEVTTVAVQRHFVARDIEHGGNGMITGTVKVDSSPDVPIQRRVRLHRQRDGIFVAETWSNPTTGAYAFTHIHRGYTYFVVAFDHDNNFRAVIADNLTPEAMS